MNKIFKFSSFFVFILLFLLLAGCKEEESTYILDKQLYSDVIGVYDDVRVVSKNEFTYLEKNGKKISANYYGIKHMNESYFLGKKDGFKYAILDKEGNETILNGDYVSFNYLSNGFIAKNKENKYTYISYTNGENGNFYDSMSKQITDNKVEDKYMITASNNTDNYNVKKYYLLDKNGNVIISDVDLLTFSRPSYYGSSNTTFIIVKKEDKYVLANDEGEYISSFYDHITSYNGLMICEKAIEIGNNTGLHYTVYNDLYQSISLNTIDEEGHLKYSINMNRYFISYIDSKDNKQVILRFNGEKVVYDKLVNNNSELKFEKDGKIGFLNYTGEEIYSELNNGSNSLSLININKKNDDLFVFLENNEEYIFKKNSEITRMPKNQNSDYDISINYLYNIPGLYLVTKTNLNTYENSYAIYSSNEGNYNNLFSLKYYSAVTVERYNGINYAILKDDNLKSLYFLDLDSGVTFKIRDNITTSKFDGIYFDERQILVNIDEYSENNTIYGFILKINYNDKVENYIIYKDQVYMEDQVGTTNFEFLGNNQVSFNYQSNYIYEIATDQTKIYAFKYENDHYILKNILTSDFYVTGSLRDEYNEKDYFVISNFNSAINQAYSAIKYGLIDENGEILLYPQFYRILQIENDNIMVENSGYYGVIKYQDKNKYKIIAEIKYQEIQFLGEGNFASLGKGDKVQFHYKDGKIEKGEIWGAGDLEYTSYVDGEVVEKDAYKIRFGQYYRIYYSTKEIKKTYKTTQPY